METQFNSNQATSSDAALATLADHVHELRPAWHRQSLATLLRDHAAAGVEYAQLRAAAIGAAKNPHYSTPAGIRFELDRLERATRQPGGGAPCATCSKPYELCQSRPRARWAEDQDDHPYEPAEARRTRVVGRRTTSSNENGEV